MDYLQYWKESQDLGNEWMSKWWRMVKIRIIKEVFPVTIERIMCIYMQKYICVCVSVDGYIYIFLYISIMDLFRTQICIQLVFKYGRAENVLYFINLLTQYLNSITLKIKAFWKSTD